MYFESHFQTFQSVMVRRMWQSREVLFAAARGNREDESPEGRAQGMLELSLLPAVSQAFSVQDPVNLHGTLKASCILP